MVVPDPGYVAPAEIGVGVSSGPVTVPQYAKFATSSVTS